MIGKKIFLCINFIVKCYKIKIDISLKNTFDLIFQCEKILIDVFAIAKII